MGNESPSYARVVLGEELRRVREQMQLKQADLADLLQCNQSKIARLETAQLHTIRMGELNTILDRLKITDGRAEELRAYARSPYGERGVFAEPSGNQMWLGGKIRAEQLASSITSFQIELFDGLLQCEQYMRLLFDLGGRTDTKTASRLRLSRQEIFSKDVPPAYTVFVGEAALHRDMGDPDTMIAQLEHTLTLAATPSVTIMVVPFTARISPKAANFTLLQFSSSVIADFVYVEYSSGTVTMDDDDSLRDYQRELHAVASGSLTPYDSLALIRQRVAHYKNLQSKEVGR